MNYAVMEDNVVVNIIWLNPCNSGDFEGACPIGDLPVSTGDVYSNGEYFRNGMKIETPTLTDTEKLKTRADAVEAAMDWVITMILGGM